MPFHPCCFYSAHAQVCLAGPRLGAVHLHMVISSPPPRPCCLQLYEGARGKASMAGQAAGLMNPEVIAKLKDLETAIRKDFM